MIDSKTIDARARSYSCTVVLVVLRSIAEILVTRHTVSRHNTSVSDGQTTRRERERRSSAQTQSHSQTRPHCEQAHRRPRRDARAATSQLELRASHVTRRVSRLTRRVVWTSRGARARKQLPRKHCIPFDSLSVSDIRGHVALPTGST